MHIEGSYEFDFKRELVWDVLMDIDVLGSIIPGSQGLQEIGENNYQGKLPVKLGPIKGKFKTKFKLADINKPKSFQLIVKSKGPGVRFTGEGVFRLNHKENVTAVRYARDVRIGGAIAPVVKGTVKRSVKKALRKLFKKIEEQCCGGNDDAH
jgi:carbon monoxide dehydrogenase subunit G